LGLSGVLGKLAPTVLRSELVKAWILMVLALMLPAAAMAEEAKEGAPKVAISA
jgi:flagellar FliL protein